MERKVAFLRKKNFEVMREFAAAASTFPAFGAQGEIALLLVLFNGFAGAAKPTFGAPSTIAPFSFI